MLLRAESLWVSLALGCSLLLVDCVQDDIGTPPLTADTLPTAADFFVSPSGSPSGNGSFANPWDLATALSGPAAVTPGSTIWLRGGTYTNPADPRGFESKLTGTADTPIVVRQFPGERATVTRTLLVTGPYTWFWGFEVTNPAPQPPEALHGVNVHAPGTKLINLVVHDATDDGIFIWPQATGAEVNGSIVYNNGRTDNLTHGIYCKSATATLLLKDNIVFDNWAFGFHCFANDGPYIQNIDVEGNVAFNNYIWGVPWDADILVGGASRARRPGHVCGERPSWGQDRGRRKPVRAGPGQHHHLQLGAGQHGERGCLGSPHPGRSVRGPERPGLLRLSDRQWHVFGWHAAAAGGQCCGSQPDRRHDDSAGACHGAHLQRVCAHDDPRPRHGGCGRPA